MRKAIILFLMIYSSLILAQKPKNQNDTVRVYVCGTGFILQQQQKIYEDTLEKFISHFDGNTENGLWITIGNMENATEVLEQVAKINNWKIEDIELLYSQNISHILFSYKNEMSVVVYKKESGTARVYDALFYKNRLHPEVIGNWFTDVFPFAKRKEKNKKLTLNYNQTDSLSSYTLIIKDDYTFRIYNSKGIESCEINFEGTYYFNQKGEIVFIKNPNQECEKDVFYKPSVFKVKYDKDEDRAILWR